MESRSAAAQRGRAERSVHASAIQGTYYRVREGDTLYSIAWRRNIDFRSLARWNGIRPPYVIH
ncbi:MAG: LysM domain-containing protein, partial [Gammaproteobacteria bacterium]